MKKNSELLKLIDLELNHQVKNSNIMAEFYKTKIRFYEELIDRLKENKPLFFRKKELEEYNKQIKEYENSIIDLYDKLSIEIKKYSDKKRVG